mmetsp:Transcript_30607/g.81736  ORF Transcript_30607/g.81736 Transcript_30607/m.81736 type:complete len:214 (+) Transcript_30607:265-906(+)
MVQRRSVCHHQHGEHGSPITAERGEGVRCNSRVLRIWSPSRQLVGRHVPGIIDFGIFNPARVHRDHRLAVYVLPIRGARRRVGYRRHLRRPGRPPLLTGHPLPPAALRLAAAAALHAHPLDGAHLLGRVVARRPLQLAENVPRDAAGDVRVLRGLLALQAHARVPGPQGGGSVEAVQGGVAARQDGGQAPLPLLLAHALEAQRPVPHPVCCFR